MPNYSGGGYPPPPPIPPIPPSGADDDPLEQVPLRHIEPYEYKGSIISDPSIGEGSGYADPTRQTFTPDTTSVIPPEQPPTLGPPTGSPDPPRYSILAAGDFDAELCCIGFNPEDSKLEAIFKLRSLTGIPGFFCDLGKVAHVGYWLIEPSNAEVFKARWDNSAKSVRFMGCSSLRISTFTKTAESVIHYAVHLELPPKYANYILTCLQGEAFKFIRLPLLHCVLTFTDYNSIMRVKRLENGKEVDDDEMDLYRYNDFSIKEANFNGRGLNWFSKLEAFIQYPKIGTQGKWDYLQRGTGAIEKSDPQTVPIHISHLPNGKLLMFSGRRVGSTNSACLFDPETDSFQLISDPLTKFQAWGTPTIPLFNGMRIIDNGNNTVTITGTSLKLKDDNIQLPKILIPEIDEDANGNIKVDFNKLEDNIQSFDAYVHDVFCSSHNLLPNGKLFIIGGQEITQVVEDAHGGIGFHQHHDRGIRQVSIFNSRFNDWNTLAPALKKGRWYPGSVMMGDGRIFVMDGHPDSDSKDAHVNFDIEIFDPKVNNWFYQKDNSVSYGLDIKGQNDKLGFYPRLILLPDGSIFCCNRIETIKNERDRDILGTFAKWLPETKTWTTVTPGVPPAANDNEVPVMRQHFTGCILPLRPALNNGFAGPMPPQYTINESQILVQSYTFQNEKEQKPADKVFLLKPLLSEKWKLQTVKVGGRTDGNCVIMADGTVILVGGSLSANGDYKTPNLEVDLYDAWSNTWSKGTPSLKRRVYHSVAILLPDARVLLAGSQGPIETSTEIYSPDYLFRGPRPKFSCTPETVGYGQFINIKLADVWTFGLINADRIGLIRLCSVTHSFAQDQRYVAIYPCHYNNEPKTPGLRYPMPESNDKEFRIQMPDNTNALPPGYYMLFLVSVAGAPSIGHIVQVL